MSDETPQKSSKLRWLLPLIIILLGIAVVFLLIKSKPQAPSRPITEKIWSVKTTAITPGAHQPELTLYGKVETPRMTHLTAAVTAYVDDVFTDEGKKMLSDQLLIKLDDRDAQLLVSQRKADLQNLLAQVEAEQIRFQSDQESLKVQQSLLQLSLNTVKRYENLIKRKVASQEQLDGAKKEYSQQRLSLVERKRSIADHPNRLKQIEAQLERAKSLLAAAELDLERTSIIAPFDGRVAQLDVSPGDRVRAGDPLIQFYSQDRIEIRSQIPNKILPQLRVQDDPTSITASSFIDGQNISLKLDRIAAAVNGSQAGVDAFFSINTDSYLPEPGRALSLTVKLPMQSNSIAIPPVALYGLDRVYKVVDERLVATEVTRIGDSHDSAGNPVVLIRSKNLAQGDLIITTQLPSAISGLRVKAIDGVDRDA